MVHNNNHVKQGVPLKLTCLANASNRTETPAIEMEFKTWNDRDLPADDRTGNRITYSRPYASNNRMLKCAGSSPAVTITALFGRGDGKNIMIDFFINGENFMSFLKYAIVSWDMEYLLIYFLCTYHEYLSTIPNLYIN